MTLHTEPALFHHEPEPRRVSLVRLSALIAQAASAIGRVLVEGEVHRVTRSKTGRLWFILRDRAAEIAATVPVARLDHCRVVDGERVSVLGRLEWVNERGRLQLVAEEVAPVGAGAIAAAIAEARRRLDADGLLDRPRRPLPRLPRAIGVVCGHEAAVRADIESVVAERFPAYPLVWYETVVSGPGAVDNLVRAVRELDAQREVEVIVLARGGGDVTQLLPFSDESVCREVCRVRTPVVAAIGHHGDQPLVDEVADHRYATPSLAAAAVVPDVRELSAELDEFLARAAERVGYRVERAEIRLGGLDWAGAATGVVRSARQRLDGAGGRLLLVDPLLAARRAGEHLDGLARHAEALSPAHVLERGYAIVRTRAGAVVRSAYQVGIGDPLDIEVSVGSLQARVEAVARGDGHE